MRINSIQTALEYLACPHDLGSLYISDLRSENNEGRIKCDSCGGEYFAKGGVIFFGYSFGKEKNQEQERTNNVLRAIGYPEETIESRDYSARKDAIDRIFIEAEKIARADPAKAPDIMQEATRARYDLEIYRGTFVLPNEVAMLIGSAQLVVEGACTTGECIAEIRKINPGAFYIGIDISGSLAIEAAAKYDAENTVFVQGDICMLPVKSTVAGAYILNNAFDRVASPKKASEEAGRILSTGGKFILSNCMPLQYEYTANGERIFFVRPEDQLSLDEGMKAASCVQLVRIDSVWNVSTVAYGSETLNCVTIGGERK